MHLVNKAVFDYGMAYLIVQLVEGLHFIHRNCKKAQMNIKKTQGWLLLLS